MSVIYMDPLPANTGVIFMEPVTGGTGIIYMDREEPVEQWYLWGSVTFPASAITETYHTTPGDYYGGHQRITFGNATKAKIEWTNGAYYRGAVLNDYRTAVHFKSQIAVGSAGDSGSYASLALAETAAQGSSVTVDIGDDGVLYNGAYMIPNPADRSGSVTFNIYYVKKS